MANTLPRGYEFVNELDIETEELWKLFEDVASGAETSSDVAIDNGERAEIDFTADEEDIRYSALGVRNSLGELVGYTAATIDLRGKGHATVDCMVVHPDENDRGIARALSVEGLHQLDGQNVGSVSFEIFGQVRKLIPRLITRHGFTYDPLNHEYISRRQPKTLERKAATVSSPLDLPEEVASEASIEPVEFDQMIDFRDAVERLIKICAEHATRCSMPVASYNNFELEIGGRTFTISRNYFDDCASWEVIERGAAELIASPHGIVMATERKYLLEKNEGKFSATYDETQEIRGDDGAMRPFMSPGSQDWRITRARHDRFMSALNRLSPEHLVPDPEVYEDEEYK